MFDDAEEGSDNDDASPQAKIDGTRHPSRLLPILVGRAEDVDDLRWPDDEKGHIDAAGNGRDDIDAREAANIFKEAHWDDRLLDIAEALVQHKRHTCDEAPDQESQDSGRVPCSGCTRTTPGDAQEEEGETRHEEKDAQEICLLEFVHFADFFAV